MEIFQLLRISSSKNDVFLFLFVIMNAAKESSIMADNSTRKQHSEAGHLMIEATSWSVTSYPNPMTDPGSCGQGKSRGYVCDPNGLISKEQATSIGSLLQDTCTLTPCVCQDQDSCSDVCPGYILAVALVHRIKTSSMDDVDINSIEAWAEFLATKQWRFGSCDNDLVLVVSSGDGQYTTYAGTLLQEKLNNNCLSAIMQSAVSNFSEHNYTAGILDLLTKYRYVLETGECTWLSHDRLAITPGAIVGITGALTVFFVILPILCFCRKRRRPMHKGRSFSKGASNGQTEDFPIELTLLNSRFRGTESSSASIYCYRTSSALEMTKYNDQNGDEMEDDVAMEEESSMKQTFKEVEASGKGVIPHSSSEKDDISKDPKTSKASQRSMKKSMGSSRRLSKSELTSVVELSEKNEKSDSQNPLRDIEGTEASYEDSPCASPQPNDTSVNKINQSDSTSKINSNNAESDAGQTLSGEMSTSTEKDVKSDQNKSECPDNQPKDCGIQKNENIITTAETRGEAESNEHLDHVEEKVAFFYIDSD